MFERHLGDGAELRALVPDHATELVDLVVSNQEHFSRWLDWARDMDSVAEAELFIRRGLARLDADGIPWIGIWQDGRMAGGILFFPLQERIRAANVGYWLAEWATGRGLMTRALEAVLEFVFQDLQINRVGLEAEPENLKSKGVAERLGFTFEGVRRQGWFNGGEFVDIAVYSLLADDWRDRTGTPH